MPFTADLFRAVDFATTVLVDEEECDYEQKGQSMVLRARANGLRSATFGEQQIEVDADGVATAIDVNSKRHDIEFRISRPLMAADLR